MGKNQLTPADFADFFQDVHGTEPFPWQQRLTSQILRQESWPKVIDLPTGTGKTSVIDTAIFTLAARPHIFPRRIVFVIDRRIVVDQVCDRAQKIVTKLQTRETPILREIQVRLGALCDGEPLGVAALRGGIPIDGEWAHHPDQPWVMVTTVDQFGSRLLFRGYGVGAGMRPIHAGLAGNDCLVILDEVHLSIPFASTLAQISKFNFGEKLPRRFSVVEMSATPANHTNSNRFTLDATADLQECEELRTRLEATKLAKLVPVKNESVLPAEILKIVKSIAKPNVCSTICAVGVVVNRVRTACAIHEKLKKAGYVAYLITGRTRPLDRIDILKQVVPIVSPDREIQPGEIAVVVATQAIEVGADFSFDALITECAAINSLKQRFGRLDRRGVFAHMTGTNAPAWIIGPKSTVASSAKPDPIYGNSIKVTWEELENRTKDGTIDVGPLSLAKFPLTATAPYQRAPWVLDSYMEAWVQTNPEPLTQPSLEWFLHGINCDTPNVSILWRWDRSSKALRLVPPRQAECLQIPIGAAKSWLNGNHEAEVADVDFFSASKLDHVRINSASQAKRNDFDWVRWAGFKKGSEPIKIDQLGPGDIIIVDPSRGGLRYGTWNPESTEIITDLGDAAQMAHGGYRATLRLDRRLFNANLPEPSSDESVTDVSTRERISKWLLEFRSASDNPQNWFDEIRYKIVDRLSTGFEFQIARQNKTATKDGYYILTERNSKTKKPLVDPRTLDGSDETQSMTGAAVTLQQHLDGVGKRAMCTARRLGLSEEFVHDLGLAGQLHDLGKVDKRFQCALVGGDLVDMAMQKEPLAKSKPGIKRRRFQGVRHEIASIAMIESNLSVLDSAHDRDLVLHLIATHHGWARPLPPIIEDLDPQILTYKFGEHTMQSNTGIVQGSLALDIADRFWRLVERYGYYGLAWLEAIFRLADHRQSAEEATHQ